MSLSVSHDGAASQIRVVGEIDMSNAHLLTELVQVLCRTPTPLVVVDLAAVRFLGAHAVSALLHAAHLVAQAGGRLTLRDPSPFALRVLDVAGVLGHLHLYGTSTPTGARLRGVVPPLPRRAAPPRQPLGPSVAAQP
ncbi:STAS domain-containing protein [Micromonospora sp. NPDC047644]|uniref:STAS domain-containing protein n=1 Tax=Micromonospora sp. NPDC047644 TaxID=3157203 RepID=UPI0034550909